MLILHEPKCAQLNPRSGGPPWHNLSWAVINKDFYFTPPRFLPKNTVRIDKKNVLPGHALAFCTKSSGAPIISPRLSFLVVLGYYIIMPLWNRSKTCIFGISTERKALTVSVLAAFRARRAAALLLGPVARPDWIFTISNRLLIEMHMHIWHMPWQPWQCHSTLMTLISVIRRCFS